MGWPRMALAGHSMGGHNSMAFSGWHPERVSALAIIDSRPSLPPERLNAMHHRGHRGPRRHETFESALASFRLLPRETTADPALLAHLGREGITQRDGRFLYRFDPATSGERQPADAWPLLERITAPTLVVRGEHSPDPARAHGAGHPQAGPPGAPGRDRRRLPPPGAGRPPGVRRGPRRVPRRSRSVEAALSHRSPVRCLSCKSTARQSQGGRHGGQAEAAGRREQAYGELTEAVAGLSEAELGQVFLGVWGTREILIHIAGWDREMTPALQRIGRGEPPYAAGLYDDADDWNARFVAARKGASPRRSWPRSTRPTGP